MKLTKRAKEFLSGIYRSKMMEEKQEKIKQITEGLKDYAKRYILKYSKDICTNEKFYPLCYESEEVCLHLGCYHVNIELKGIYSYSTYMHHIQVDPELATAEEMELIQQIKDTIKEREKIKRSNIEFNLKTLEDVAKYKYIEVFALPIDQLINNHEKLNETLSGISFSGHGTTFYQLLINAMQQKYLSKEIQQCVNIVNKASDELLKANPQLDITDECVSPYFFGSETIRAFLSRHPVESRIVKCNSTYYKDYLSAIDEILGTHYEEEYEKLLATIISKNKIIKIYAKFVFLNSTEASLEKKFPEIHQMIFNLTSKN